jgi:hypothetical protein
MENIYKCKECEFETDNNAVIANHYKYKHNDNSKIICICGKILKTKGGYTYHLKSCKGIKQPKEKECIKCGFIIKANFERHTNYCDGSGPRRSRPKVSHGWSKGLTKDTDERIKRLSNSLKLKTPIKHTDETKLLLSNLIKKRYEDGWESTAGRCKKIEYNSKVAGIIKVDGSWELKVSIYLDSIGVKWIRNKKRFTYNNTIKNCTSTYCPDFYIYDWNCYIEVKGYKTELDDIKWEQFKESLQIWDKNKLLSLGISIY